MNSFQYHDHSLVLRVIFYLDNHSLYLGLLGQSNDFLDVDTLVCECIHGTCRYQT